MQHTLLFAFFLSITTHALHLPHLYGDQNLSTLTSRDDSVPPIVAAGGETYSITPPGSPTPQNRIGTYLYGFEGCTRAQKDKINGAYYDAWTMSKLAGVASGIDWNQAPALEFLGPPGLNAPQQAQIQALLANMATVIYSYKQPLFQHALHVRCDDPGKKCQNRPADDPCVPDPPNPDQQPLSLPNAYSGNHDPNDGYPMINFCDGFMNLRSLKDGYTYGSMLLSPDRYNIIKYNNRATTFFHELLHLDLAADSSPGNTPNPRTDDLTISIKVGSESVHRVAYGGLGTKLLARTVSEPGYYVQRNAENFAFFALAKYIMSENGNVYPHLPIVYYRLDGVPWKNVGSDDYVFSFSDDTQGVFLDASSSDPSTLASELPDLEDVPGCSDRMDPTGDSVIDINSLLPLEAYPADYIEQQTAWLQGLSDLAAPAAGASPSQASTAPAAKVSTSSPARDTCGDWYKFFFDHFEIYGQNFDPAKFGDDGSGLRNQISGCGDLTKWDFHTLTNDPNGYQWYASGDLPIGTKACVGRAVVSAGGSSPGGCTGSG